MFFIYSERIEFRVLSSCDNGYSKSLAVASEIEFQGVGNYSLSSINCIFYFILSDRYLYPENVEPESSIILFIYLFSLAS